jgi:hypothetical protein
VDLRRYASAASHIALSALASLYCEELPLFALGLRIMTYRYATWWPNGADYLRQAYGFGDSAKPAGRANLRANPLVSTPQLIMGAVINAYAKLI